MKLFSILIASTFLLCLTVKADESPTLTELSGSPEEISQGTLTQLTGTPDVIEVDDLKADRVAIEANGASFLVNLFSKPLRKNHKVGK